MYHVKLCFVIFLLSSLGIISLDDVERQEAPGSLFVHQERAELSPNLQQAPVLIEETQCIIIQDKTQFFRIIGNIVAGSITLDAFRYLMTHNTWLPNNTIALTSLLGSLSFLSYTLCRPHLPLDLSFERNSRWGDGAAFATGFMIAFTSLVILSIWET